MESQAAGEQVAVVPRARAGDDIGPDFWLFAAGTDGAGAAVLRYGQDGQWLGFDVVDDPDDVATFDARCRRLADEASTLNVFLAARTGASA